MVRAFFLQRTTRFMQILRKSWKEKASAETLWRQGGKEKGHLEKRPQFVTIL